MSPAEALASVGAAALVAIPQFAVPADAEVTLVAEIDAALVAAGLADPSTARVARSASASSLA